MKKKSLASVFRVPLNEAGGPRWQMQCEYCGHVADCDSIEGVAEDFFEHMFGRGELLRDGSGRLRANGARRRLGPDTSKEHMEYAAKGGTR